MTDFKPKTPIKPETFSIILPGLSPVAVKLSEELLVKNNKFHIFFNESKFHNHLIHHLLAAFSLGASQEKLQEIYDYHAKAQRPIPPSVGEITRENYKEYLGKAESYTSFLKFYQTEVGKYGTVDTVRRWVWSDDMLARIVGGVFHPLIHIGYGLEFDIPGIVAEGLAMAACTEANHLDLIPRLPDLDTSALLPTQAQAYAENATSTAKGYMSTLVDNLSHQITTRLGMSGEPPGKTDKDRSSADKKAKIVDDLPPYLKENTLFQIFNEIREDSTFDGLFAADDNMRFKVLRNDKKANDRMKHYLDKWQLEENTKDIQAKFKELYTLVAVTLGSTGIRKEYPGVLKLDFYIMHALTSSEFLHQYISKVAPSESVSLLKAHAAITMFYYITSGRPNFNIDSLLAYKSPSHDEKNNNNWLVTFDKALACDEPHVIKVVRSCAVAQVIYGPYDDMLLNEVWLKVAQMAVDKDGHWDFAGSGFEANWTPEHDAGVDARY